MQHVRVTAAYGYREIPARDTVHVRLHPLLLAHLRRMEWASIRNVTIPAGAVRDDGVAWEMTVHNSPTAERFDHGE